MKRLLLCLGTSLFGAGLFPGLLGCASTYSNPHMQLIPESDYFSVVDKNTQKKQIYDGFMNTLDLSITMLTTELMRNQTDQQARIYQWTPENYQIEKGKVESDLAKETSFFVSVFVPERKHDDLHKKTTNWKMFLDVGGKRYEGKATRSKAQLAELVSLYPHHTRWQSAYKISFPVSTVIAENGDAKFTLTGPVASATFEFKK